MYHYERALRQAELVIGLRPTGYGQKWLANAARRAVPPEVIVEITRQHRGVLSNLRILETAEEIVDPHGKSYFLLPETISADGARLATLMTYVVNAGTDYGRADLASRNDFAETPYCVDELRRIAARQQANRWSYVRDVRFVHRNGGRLVTTPHGILMGLGGNRLQRLFSQRGGTAWGDIFMVNLGRVADPAQQIRAVVESGRAWFTDSHGQPVAGNLDLDRVLHHEERHSVQWAAKGYAGMIAAYGWEAIREVVFRKTNRLEEDAGLRDGGYL